MLGTRAGRSAPPPALWTMLAAMAVGLVLFAWASGANIDEFAELYNAQRLASGQIIYRDFLEFIPPGSEGLAALLFLITGPSVLAARLLEDVLLLAMGVALYDLARGLGLPPAAAAVPGPMFVWALYRVFPSYNHHWLSAACGVAALWALQHGLRTASARWGLLAGAAAAATLLCTQSEGLIACAAVATGLCVGWLWGARSPRVAAAVALGFAGVLGGVLAWLAAHAALDDTYRLTWIWPRQHYKTPGGFNDVSLWAELAGQWDLVRGTRGGPFGLARVGYVGGLLLLWPAALAAIGGEAKRLWPRPPAPLRDPAAAATVAMLGVLALGHAVGFWVGRTDLNHVAMYGLPDLLWVCVGAHRWRVWQAGRAGGGLQWLPFVALAGLGLAGGMLVLEGVVQRPGDWLDARTPDARYAADPVITLIQAHAGPNDRIVSLPWGGFHYMYGRPAATKYTQLLPTPLRYNTAAEWQDLEAEIATRRPKLVIMQLAGPASAIPLAFPGWTLPGYHLLATAPARLFNSAFQAHCFERDAQPASPASRAAP